MFLIYELIDWKPVRENWLKARLDADSLSYGDIGLMVVMVVTERHDCQNWRFIAL